MNTEKAVSGAGGQLDRPDQSDTNISSGDESGYCGEPVNDPVADCAYHIFGIQTLYPWQRLVIANIIDAVNAASQPEETHEGAISSVYDEDGILRGRQIVLLPTGAGKSLCFQIPALLLEKPTLIIYPLLALMNDQVRRMQAAGLEPVIFRGGQTPEERAAQYARLDGTKGTPAKLIIANPEVLEKEEIVAAIARCGISHLVVDEAHCITEWGETFRPAYLSLKQLVEHLHPPAITAFTATAGDEVLKQMGILLFGGKAHLVRGESDRKNITYTVIPCRVKYPALLHAVQNRQRPMVIFCGTRSRAEQAAAFLRYTLKDSRIRFYHAGLQREEKYDIEQWFHHRNDAILTVTCAWGMGIDKKNVRTVIHLDPSPTAEAYAQESGRGGRDGNPSQAVLLWSPEDVHRKDMLPALQQQRYNGIIAFAASGRCRRAVLLDALGEKKARTRHSGAEETACSGCDVCSGTAQTEPADEKMLKELIRRRKNRYTVQTLITAMQSVLPHWRAADAAQLISMLLHENTLYIKRGLWKNRISDRR